MYVFWTFLPIQPKILYSQPCKESPQKLDISHPLSFFSELSWGKDFFHTFCTQYKRIIAHFAHSTRELLLTKQSFLNIVIIYAVPQIQFHNKDSDLFLAGKSYTFSSQKWRRGTDSKIRFWFIPTAGNSYAFSSQEGDRFEYLLHFSLLSNFSKQVLFYK